MLRHALAEVRLHPARFVSTIVAIAISVAFLVGSSVLVASQGRAQAASMNLGISRADVVVETDGDQSPASVLEAVDGVAAVAPLLVSTTTVHRGAGRLLVELHQVLPEPLRWAELSSGRWPATASEIVLNRGASQELGVQIGDAVTGTDGNSLTVVGTTAEPGTSFAQVGYAVPAWFAEDGYDPAIGSGTWLVAATDGVDATELAPRIADAFPVGDNQPVVRAGDEVRAQAMLDATRNFDVFKYLLWAFAAIALVVGMITVANTFAITLAQRRRQIGLLRAVGASGAQLRRRYLAEGLVLGVLGGLLGVGLGIGVGALAVYLTGAWFWGVQVPVAEVVVSFGLGVLSTVIASWFPVQRGTRVHPLEALSPVLDASEQRRVGRVRLVVCGLFLLAGAGLVWPALGSSDLAFGYAIGAGALISVGVLFGAPLFVPALLKLTGRLMRPLGTVPGLAARNAERNPRRATTTATALMLAIGLIVTLQVATASIRQTMLTELDRITPVDLSITWRGELDAPASLPSEVQTRLAGLPGVSESVGLDSLPVELSGGSYSNEMNDIGWDAGMQATTGSADTVGDDQVLVVPMMAQELPETVTLLGGGGSRELRVVASYLADWGSVVVSQATLRELGTPVLDSVWWLSVPDRTDASSVLTRVTDVAGSQGLVAGSLPMAASVEQALDLLLGITTALLAVAVLIALVGVSNTLGLSVLERRRESALLRALGLQSRSLRWMLAFEALQVTLIAVLVGLVFGVLFGWLAVSSIGPAMRVERVIFAVDVPQTLGMLAIAVLAAVLASVGPGRRAAKAAPTEALADI